MRIATFLKVAGLVLGLALGLAGRAQAADPLAVLPYRIDYGGWFTVSGTIKGKGPFDLIIDTGSMRSLLFASAVDRIGGVVLTNDPPISIIGLSSRQKFPTFRVGDVVVGGLTMADLVTVVLPDWIEGERAPQGVLGLDFLERYHVEIDARARVLRLYARDARYAPPSSRWRAVPLSRKNFGLEDGFLHTVKGSLNAASVEFLVDLGATGTIVNTSAAARGRNRGIAIDRGQGGRARVKDAVDTRTNTRAEYFSRFAIGRTRWDRAVLIVYDAPVIEELGAADRPFGLIGSNLFWNRSVALDFAEGRLYIGPYTKR